MENNNEILSVTFNEHLLQIVAGKAKPIPNNKFGAKIFTEKAQVVTRECIDSVFALVSRKDGGSMQWKDSSGNTCKITVTKESE